MNSIIILQFIIMLSFVKKSTNECFVKECETLNMEVQKHWCISGQFFGGSLCLFFFFFLEDCNELNLAPKVEMGDLRCI